MGCLKTLISDNAPEFFEESLCSWLKRIGGVPYKTLPYHLQSNGIAEIMAQTVKMGLKAFSTSNDNVESYLPRLLLRY